MKILLVDDDQYKIDKVVECLNNVEYDVAKSYNSALRSILLKEYDGVILDMGFPMFDDDYQINPEQGLLVLSEMKRKKRELPVMIYSGNQIDVSEFNFVRGYILADNTYIKERIDKFIDNL